MVDGININQEDADQEYLPDDLNSLAVGSYVVPNPSKRKVYPVLSFIVGLLFLAASYFLDFINFVPVFLLIAFISIFFTIINNKFKINQSEVIESIAALIPHSIGYYSIALTFNFSIKAILTPVWTVIVYSHENPPIKKTIVEINAFSGIVVTEPYTENINA
jgi:hypothetical protein